MSEIHYSIRDPWRAPRLGASGRKMRVAFKSIIYGYFVYLFFAYASHMSAGTSPVAIWQAFHFFPSDPAFPGEIPSHLWNLGLVASILVVMMGSTGIVKLTYRQMKGDDFYGASDAWKCALERGRSTVFTPLMLLILFGLVCLSLWLLAWTSKIPGVGPLVLGLSVIPAFFVALIGIYLLISLLLSLIYAPAVMGTTGDDGLEGVVQVMSLLWSMPWRTLSYTAATFAASTVATWLLAIISMGAMALTLNIFSKVYGFGSEFSTILTGMMSYLPLEPTILSSMPSWLWPGPFVELFPLLDTTSMATGNLSGIGSLESFLGGVSMLIVLGMVLSFWVSCLMSGITASFLALRRMKDGEILLDWADEIDELEEKAAARAESVGAESAGAEEETEE